MQAIRGAAVQIGRVATAVSDFMKPEKIEDQRSPILLTEEATETLPPQPQLVIDDRELPTVGEPPATAASPGTTITIENLSFEINQLPGENSDELTEKVQEAVMRTLEELREGSFVA